MALSDQIRKRRLEEGLSIAELSRLSHVSRGYLSQLENNISGVRPSANILYKIASALGTSVGELLGKQENSALMDVPKELQQFALAEHLSDEEIKLLAGIEYRGRRPRTVEDWRFIYEAIKRSVS